MGNKQSNDYEKQQSMPDDPEHDIFPRPVHHAEMHTDYGYGGGGGRGHDGRHQGQGNYDSEDEGDGCCTWLMRFQSRLYVMISAAFVLVIGLLLASWSMYATLFSPSFATFSDMSWLNSYPLGPAMWGLFAIGVLTVVAAIFGICGAWRESRPCLMFYAAIAILFGLFFLTFGPIIFWGSSSATPSVFRTVNEICQNAPKTMQKLNCGVQTTAVAAAAGTPVVAASPLLEEGRATAARRLGGTDTNGQLHYSLLDTMALVGAGLADSHWRHSRSLGHNATTPSSAEEASFSSSPLSRRLTRESHKAVNEFLAELGQERGCSTLGSLCALPDAYDASTACNCNGMMKPINVVTLPATQTAVIAPGAPLAGVTVGTAANQGLPGGVTRRRLDVGATCASMSLCDPNGFVLKSVTTGLTCAASPCTSSAADQAACCDPVAKCSTNTCGSGKQLKANAASLSCQLATCVSAVDDNACCDQAQGLCSAGGSCPAHYKAKPNAATATCASTVCDFNLQGDLDACCEQLPPQPELCSEVPSGCGAGFQARTSTVVLYCSAATCNFDGPDKETCCQASDAFANTGALCNEASATCPGGYELRNGAGSIRCRDATCSLGVGGTDLDLCCISMDSTRALCTSEACNMVGGYTPKLDNTLRCASTPCTFSIGSGDLTTCCDQVVTTAAGALCSTLTCSATAGYVQKPITSGVAVPHCAATICQLSDLGACCDVEGATTAAGALCSTLTCSATAGYVQKPLVSGAAVPHCAATICSSVTDLGACCNVQAVTTAALCSTLTCSATAGYVQKPLVSGAALPHCAATICSSVTDLGACCNVQAQGAVQAAANAPVAPGVATGLTAPAAVAATTVTATTTLKFKNPSRGAYCDNWDTELDGAWCFVNAGVTCTHGHGVSPPNEPVTLEKKSTGPCGPEVASRSALVLRGMNWLNWVAIISIIVGISLFVSAGCACWIFRHPTTSTSHRGLEASGY